MINEAIFEADYPEVTSLPEQARVAIENAQVTEPQVGQVWRLTWGGVPPRLALVTHVAEWYVHVIPLTLLLDRRVDAAMVVDVTPLQVPVVAWPQLRTGVGDFALAECYGSIDDTTAQILIERSLGRATSDDLTVWNEGLTPDEIGDRRTYRNRLIADFAALCDSDWNLADLNDEPEQFLDSTGALAAGLTLPVLADAAQMDPVAAYPLWEGAQPLPPGLSDSLIERFGQPVRAAIRALSTDREARATLDSPEYRQRIVAASQKAAVPEDRARRDIYREMVGAPGRETGATTKRDYRTVLKMILDARLK